jgi:hypothetical protein
MATGIEIRASTHQPRELNSGSSIHLAKATGLDLPSQLLETVAGNLA